MLQTFLLYRSIKKNLEWMEMFDGMSDDYKEVIETLDALHRSVDKKSKLELFLDEPVTRELVDDIKETKKAIKKAAEKISVFIEEENEEEKQK
jgi:hypothetical protein